MISDMQLSRWWRSKSAKAAMRRVEKQKRERIKKLRKGLAQKKEQNGNQ